MDHFKLRNGELFVEDVPLSRIAEDVGTPVYVYSLATLQRHARVFREALSGLDKPQIAFAVRADPNLAVLRVLANEGYGADVVSGGELTRALAAGMRPQEFVFSGVGKARGELLQALEVGIARLRRRSSGARIRPRTSPGHIRPTLQRSPLKGLTMLSLPSLATALTLTSASVAAAASPTQTAQQMLNSPAYLASVAQMDREHERVVSEIVTLTEIPAPPFKEAKRAAAYRDMLKVAGLQDVEIDSEGNAIGLYRGTGAAGGPVVVLAAHLDTVFPEETVVKVRRDGNRLYAPGIGDDTRSLAVLLAYARAMKANGVKTKHDILFVGNVGEEGPGDLRGVRYLLTKGKYKGRVKIFFSMDGTDAERLVTGGVGSKRYRVTFKGPGGHSYGAFGLVNPMVAMSQTVVDFYQLPVPTSPKTTYAASVVGGGTSVNSIPNEVFMEFDMRSEDPAELAKIEKGFLEIVGRSVDLENRSRQVREGKVVPDIKLIGDRPAGRTPASAEVVQIASAVIEAKGTKPRPSSSSTDSNLAMSIGIPAVTIGSGGKGGRSHSLDEWIDVEKEGSLKGMAVGLGILLATAGVQ